MPSQIKSSNFFFRKKTLFIKAYFIRRFRLMIS